MWDAQTERANVALDNHNTCIQCMRASCIYQCASSSSSSISPELTRLHATHSTISILMPPCLEVCISARVPGVISLFFAGLPPLPFPSCSAGEIVLVEVYSCALLCLRYNKEWGVGTKQRFDVRIATDCRILVFPQHREGG